MGRRIIFLLCFLSSFYADLASQSVYESYFTHPGILHSANDLDRMKQNVLMKKEPWASAWADFLKSKWLTDKYKARPLEIVGRGVGSVGQDNIQNDCAAAYYNSIAWYISGDARYAQRAVNIINAWSHKLKVINGKDAILCSAIYGYKFANAAEILRFSYADWSGKDIDLCKKMLLEVFYPVIKDFAPFANGNWDAACVTTMMSIGVFCDNREMFDRAVKYYNGGSGNGSVLNYIVNENGQGQESGRDQPHAHLGISFLALAAETGYHQGLDMYGVYNNRLLKAFEYTSKYNLGFNDVPFEPTFDRTGKYNHTIISTKDRRKILTGSELVFNHYKNRMGIEAPFTEKTARNARPETMSYDMPGAGTLLFALPANSQSAQKVTKAPTMTGGLEAKYKDEVITLSWISVLNANSYTVTRTNQKSGEELVVARDLKTAGYVDKSIKPGIVYDYKVKATNDKGESPASLSAVICAGLPKSWESTDVGAVVKSGNTNFDGKTFSIEASGTDISKTADQFQYAFTSLNGNGTITARFVPQVASQFVKMGVMIRESVADNAKHASLLIMPVKATDIEVPGWYTNLVVRRTAGDSSVVAVQSKALNEDFISWGRLVNPCWLKLTRNENFITAYVSTNGTTWIEIDKAEVLFKKKVLIGIALCSGLTKVTTVANFDNVEVDVLK